MEEGKKGKEGREREKENGGSDLEDGWESIGAHIGHPFPRHRRIVRQQGRVIQEPSPNVLVRVSPNNEEVVELMTRLSVPPQPRATLDVAPHFRVGEAVL